MTSSSALWLFKLPDIKRLWARPLEGASLDQIKPLEQITNGIVSFLSGRQNIPTCEDHQEFDSKVFM